MLQVCDLRLWNQIDSINYCKNRVVHERLLFFATYRGSHVECRLKCWLTSHRNQRYIPALWMECKASEQEDIKCQVCDVVTFRTSFFKGLSQC